MRVNTGIEGVHRDHEEISWRLRNSSYVYRHAIAQESGNRTKSNSMGLILDARRHTPFESVAYGKRRLWSQMSCRRDQTRVTLFI